MGSLTLAYPSIAGKTTQEQLESMRRYLCSVTEQLNLADWSAKATLTEISQAIDADSLSEAEKKTTLSGYAALKSLIIKTADFAAANSETWSTKLSGSYVAISDFGKYLEKTQLTIEGNSVGIKQLYDYTAGVNNQFSVNSQQYIKTGLLYYKDAVPVYGVGVGNIETTVTDGGERVIDQTKNELVTVTPDRVSFWQDGQEVAYLSDKKLHFPSGTLEAAGAVLSVVKGSARIDIKPVPECNSETCIEQKTQADLVSVKNKKMQVVGNTFTGEEIKRIDFSSGEPFFYINFFTSKNDFSSGYFLIGKTAYSILAKDLSYAQTDLIFAPAAGVRACAHPEGRSMVNWLSLEVKTAACNDPARHIKRAIRMFFIYVSKVWRNIIYYILLSAYWGKRAARRRSTVARVREKVISLYCIRNIRSFCYDHATKNGRKTKRFTPIYETRRPGRPGDYQQH